MTVANRRRLEEAHHRSLRIILNVESRSDEITNESIKESTGQKDIENIIRKKRLRWLGHLWRRDKDRRANQIYCVGFRRDEREEEDRGRIGYRPLRTISKA